MPVNYDWKFKNGKIVILAETIARILGLSSSHDMDFAITAQSFHRLNPGNTSATKAYRISTEILTSGMHTDQLTLDAGKKKKPKQKQQKTRAFEVVDTDITNTARFGTKGLGSTIVTQIKQNADGCFSDASHIKQTGQKNVCLFKDLLTTTDIQTTE